MYVRLVTILTASVLLSGCGSTGSETLLFGQSDKIGIGVAAGAVNQGVDAHLGYKGLNVARVPVTTRQTAEDGSEEVVKLGGLLLPRDGGAGLAGSFSVLGQFESQAGGGKAGLGKYFTTGPASRYLAAGYEKKYKKPPTD